MSAILSYRTTYMPKPWSGYYELEHIAMGQMKKIVSDYDYDATLTRMSDKTEQRYQTLLDDVIADAKPTWSEMVDHWVWYCLEGWAFDFTSESRYRNNERYDVVHEMLGIAKRKDVIGKPSGIGDQLLQAMQDFGIEVPQ